MAPRPPAVGRPAPRPGEAATVRRQVDPAWDYTFEGSKFVPPPGKTLLVLGQTLGGIDEHVDAFPDQPVPGGWAAYWGIPSMDGVDSTFLSDTGGRQNHQLLVERPIYLRIGYEFDGPHNELEPNAYVAAYRRIVDIMRSEGVENVAYVWHSYASAPYGNNPISAWYPGEDYVDWVGISLFGHMYASSVSSDLDAVFRFAREERKPVMVAEASPVRGISSPSDWDDWFVNFFSLAYTRNIKAISFINEDWERFNFPGLNWGDARLQNVPEVADAFFEEIKRDRYLKQSPELFEQIGYTPPGR